MESLKGMKNSTVQRLTFMSQLDGIFACPDAWFKIIALFTLFLWGYCWVRIITLKSVSWEKQLIFSNVGGPHLIGWRFAESSKFVIYWSQAELSLPRDWSTGFSFTLLQMDTSSFRLELHHWPFWVSCLSVYPEDLWDLPDSVDA